MRLIAGSDQFVAIIGHQLVLKPTGKTFCVTELQLVRAFSRTDPTRPRHARTTSKLSMLGRLPPARILPYISVSCTVSINVKTDETGGS